MLATTGRNWMYFSTGLALHAMTSLKHRLQGYTSPTDFPAADWPRSIGHAEGIVADYARQLAGFRPGATFEGLDVLELGPGATLATGALMIGRGAKSYLAVDAVPLARGVPPKFYDALGANGGLDLAGRARMSEAVGSFIDGKPGPLGYAVDPAFDIVRAAHGRTFDLIVSNAAFEHFDDIAGTILQLAEVAAPRAVFLALVDFQTHTRWVRERDPNNIYRLPSAIYRSLHFVGQPNRMRPRDYVGALTKSGWINTEVHGVDLAPPGYIDWSRSSLAEEFRDTAAQMDILTGAILAERPR